MTQRRYDEDEVRRIFDAATEVDADPGSRRDAGDGGSGPGFTLAELKEIGAEAGISAQLVERAARNLDAPGGAAPAVRRGGGPPTSGVAEFHRILGMPLGVDRDEILPRMLTGDEWGQIVLDARRAFSARGRTEEVGSLREWRNGNLFVALTPDGDGARLSMGTRKGAARPVAVMGLGLLTIAVVLVVASLLVPAAAPGSPVILGGLGAAMLGITFARLPSWARTRARQMDALADKALEMANRPPTALPGASDDPRLGPGEEPTAS